MFYCILISKFFRTFSQEVLFYTLSPHSPLVCSYANTSFGILKDSNIMQHSCFHLCTQILKNTFHDKKKWKHRITLQRRLLHLFAKCQQYLHFYSKDKRTFFFFHCFSNVHMFTEKNWECLQPT